MERADVIIIGGGLLGCFAARAMAEYELKTLVLEKREDVCTGVSRANTGIVYTGGDTAPGTLKTEMCVRANASFGELCRELDVKFSRCGSLMLAFGPRAERVLYKKLAQGIENGVPGLELFSGAEVLRREPSISPDVTMGLWAPGTGTVNPWELGIAAFENAGKNGVDFRFHEELRSIRRESGGFVLETERMEYRCRAVINCAGLSADTVRELAQTPSVRIVPNRGDYLVLDSCLAGSVKHIIFHEPEVKGKGLTLVPTVDGNILLGPTERPEGGEDYATEGEGLEQLFALCAQILPTLPVDKLIRSFGAVRPNPYHIRWSDGEWQREERSISNFTIMDEEGLYSLVGIKTPGLTCAAELGKHTAAMAAAYIGCDKRNPRFDPIRRGVTTVRELSLDERAALIRENPDFGQIVCRCREVSLAEVKEAIARGASTVDGVKRRTGAGMGRCQGGYCMQSVLLELAKARDLPAEAITKDGGETKIVYGKI